MNIICENCKAPYTGSISPYSKFVKCPYCNGMIKVPTETATVKKRVVLEEVMEPRNFSLTEFQSFLVRRGMSSFDSVSHIVRVGNQEVVVNDDGSVSGPEPSKSRVEKWIQEFMATV